MISRYLLTPCFVAVLAFVFGYCLGRTDPLGVFAVNNPTQTWWAFGDSITAGEGVGVTNSYANQFANANNFEINNWAVSGHTSTDCLELLNGMSTAQWDSMHHADGVILCIGANDILSLVSATIGNPTTPQEIVTAAESLQSAAFQTAMQTALYNFEINYIAILDKIKNDNIIALTVYNPYSGVVINIPLLNINFNLGLLAENYITQLNEIIKKHSSRYFDMFASIKAYENEHGRPPVFANFTNLTNINYDPHLTLAGQTYIAEQFGVWFQQENNPTQNDDTVPNKLPLWVILLICAGAIITVGGVLFVAVKRKRT